MLAARWFASTNQTPMFAFGHGLSYTSFEYRDLVVIGRPHCARQFQRY